MALLDSLLRNIGVRISFASSVVGGRSSSLHLAAKFRFAIFDSAEHTQAALEKIQAQPLEGPPCPLHVRYYNAPGPGVKRGTPSDTLYFGQLSPKIEVADVEELLKQFPGFISFDQGAQFFFLLTADYLPLHWSDNIFWFAKFDTAENATAAKESIQKAPDFPSRPWRVVAGIFSNKEDRCVNLPTVVF
jgi:hypothetical protein